MESNFTPDIQFAAFAQAICDVLTVNYAEMQILRDLLDENGTISKAEFEAAKQAFPQERFEMIGKELNAQTLAKARQIVQQMTTRRNVH